MIFWDYGRISDLKLETESWTQYEERLSRDFLVNNIEYANKKRAILLSVIGAETLLRHQHQEICQISRTIWASWITVAGSFRIYQPSWPPFTSCSRKSPGSSKADQLLIGLNSCWWNQTCLFTSILPKRGCFPVTQAHMAWVLLSRMSLMESDVLHVHYHKLKSSIPCLRKKPWLQLKPSYSCFWKSTALVFNSFSIWLFLQVQVRSAVV